MDGTKILSIFLLIFAVDGIGVLAWFLLEGRRMDRELVFRESEKALHNPLSGFAPPAELGDVCRDTALVYIGLTWAMWEPSPGAYDTDTLESHFQIRRWKAEGKHAVLRFLCDIPGKKIHMDIPEWLYRQTGDGEFYNISLGRGYAPDYGNEIFRERHRKAVAALARYFGRDGFLAYVELGSLGHGGEWRTRTEEGVSPLPEEDVCREYACAYLDHFDRPCILMPRNYHPAFEEGMGLYYPGVSDPEGMERWRKQIRRGDRPGPGEAPLTCVPMKSFWEEAPAGGHLSPGEGLEQEGRIREICSLVRKCRLTYLGTGWLYGMWKDSGQARRLERQLGPRYFVSRLRVRHSLLRRELRVSLTWENRGTAPLYWDWPAFLSVFDLDGNQVCVQEVEVDLARLYPGLREETVTCLPLSEEFREGYQLGVGITDPEEVETVELAMEGDLQDGVQVIYVWENGKGAAADGS